MSHISAMPAVWNAIYAALNVSSMTTTLGCAVYDHVPQPAPNVYLRMSSPTENRMDTFGADGKDVTVQLHIHTSSDVYRGGGKAQAILSHAITLLHHVSLTVSGQSLLVCAYEDGFDAGDEEINGVIYKHYVGTFRVRVME